MNRRRFLAVSAAMLGGPAAADPAELRTWTGRALGAEVRVTLRGGTPRHALHIFGKVEALLNNVEEHFSLYRDSALTRLNRIGRLAHPPPAMLDLVQLAGEIQVATGGLFDPTIQPLWLATAGGGDVAAARRLVGWERVRISGDEIALEPGMQLTFNGIAQGHGADQVADLLTREGYRDVLIDTGEISARGKRPDGRNWTVAIARPDGANVARTQLADRALAVSSPQGTRIGAGAPHIINPRGHVPPVWDTVAVSAPSAALADGLSTAFCLMDQQAIHGALARFPGSHLEFII